MSTSAMTLPSVWTDHAVLQQRSSVRMWGWGKPNETIRVIPEWSGEPVETVVGWDASWHVFLDTPEAGGPYTILVQGYSERLIKDVLIGEVWMCTGQSNMEWSPGAGMDGGAELIRNADYPEIRFFSVSHRTSAVPQLDVVGSWEVCRPESVEWFSAIAYVFGREVHVGTGFPVGLVLSAWGGTPAETWMPDSVVNEDPVLLAASRKLQQEEWGPVMPGLAYHAMLEPLTRLRIAGAIWYQGESNVEAAESYDQILRALVESWRKAWAYSFPFLYVQVAPWSYGSPYAGAELRDAQRRALPDIPDSGMAVISDAGDLENIHPPNKIDPGLRLARLAMSRVYGSSDPLDSGPLFREMQVSGSEVRLFFDHVDGGWVTASGWSDHFEVAGPDQVFHAAQARLDGETILVVSESVSEPVAVRFAYRSKAQPGLYNKAGIPASCFRTDRWPLGSP